jgi:protocatechuate 3,4-dioxygenase beta subunit
MKKIIVFCGAVGFILLLAFVLWWQLAKLHTPEPNLSPNPAPAQKTIAPEPAQEAPQGNKLREDGTYGGSNSQEDSAHDRVDVFGTVRDQAGSPIRGAEVKAFQGSDYRRVGKISTATLADGTYSLSGLHFPSAVPYQVVASAKGYAPAYSTPFYMKYPPKRIDFTLPKGSFLSGRVMNESRRAIPGAILHLVEGTFNSPIRRIEGETDSDGVYVFRNLSPGKYWLFAFAEPYIDQHKMITITEHDTRVSQDLLMEYAGEGYLSGTVLDESDQPIAGVRIEASQPKLGALLTGMAIRWGNSSADGSFLLEGFVPEGSNGSKMPIEIGASKEGYEKARATAFANDEEVLIRLRHKGDTPGSISGRVVEEDSSTPIADFRVEILLGNGAFASHRFQSPTGKFLIPDIDEGNYDLYISAPNRAPHFQEDLVIKSGQETSAGEIKLARGSTITGKVEKGESTPVLGAMVYVKAGKWGRHLRILVGASTDETGSYRLEGVPPGSHCVLASHPDYATAMSPEIRVFEGKEYSDIDLVLGNGGAIEGHITDNGMPLAGQMITFQAVDQSESQGRRGTLGPLVFIETNENGYYHHDKLMPGFYCLWANIPTRYSDASGEYRIVNNTVEVFKERTTTFDFDLCEGGSVRGRVISEDPIPTGAVRVEVRLLPGNIFSDKYKHNDNIHITSTSVGSSYSFGNVCPGEYTVSPYYVYETPEGTFVRNIPAARIIEVEEGKTTEKDLIFRGLIYE